MNREALFTRLIGLTAMIPKGAGLRQRLYRSILHQMGQAVYIQPDVEISGAERLSLGDGVCILRGTYLGADEPDARIAIGDRVMIRRGVEIEAIGAAQICIGARTVISSYAWILGVGDIAIGEDCLISPRVGIVGSNRHYRDTTRPINHQGGTALGITIGNDCWLGHGVTVVDGVTIGEGSVVGAGAVVTKDIPPYSIAVGVPAKVIGSRAVKVAP